MAHKPAHWNRGWERRWGRSARWKPWKRASRATVARII